MMTVNYYYQRGARRVSKGSRSEGHGTFRLLKFSVLANHVIDHVIVGILLAVYSGVDHINTTCLSPPSCHSTQVML